MGSGEIYTLSKRMFQHDLECRRFETFIKPLLLNMPKLCTTQLGTPGIRKPLESFGPSRARAIKEL